MNKLFDVVLIVGFVVMDFFFFHDAFKAGESISAAQYLAGALSVLVILRSLGSLLAAPARYTQ
jgi:hypothetical protein